jgi:enoyl-CoA hydratase/carnithine racemase
MEDTVIVTRDGPIARVMLNRPERGNMLTIAMVAEVTERIAEAGRDPGLKAIVITGAGADFCLGRDPEGAPERAPRNALEMRSDLTAPILGFYTAVRSAEIPVIAVVNGLANGFGCAAAAVCDVTIAAADARFALPEMKHDLPPTLAMCAHIDRTLPKSIAWMVYSTRELDAATARALGFVSHVAAEGGLEEDVADFLSTIVERSRESLMTCKTYLANARLMETDKASDYAGNLLAVIMSSR